MPHGLQPDKMFKASLPFIGSAFNVVLTPTGSGSVENCLFGGTFCIRCTRTRPPVDSGDVPPRTRERLVNLMIVLTSMSPKIPPVLRPANAGNSPCVNTRQDEC